MAVDFILKCASKIGRNRLFRPKIVFRPKHRKGRKPKCRNRNRNRPKFSAKTEPKLFRFAHAIKLRPSSKDEFKLLETVMSSAAKERKQAQDNPEGDEQEGADTAAKGRPICDVFSILCPQIRYRLSANLRYRVV